MSVHELAVRIYYDDTDAGGIVYYANYLRYAERARTEMLREAGYHHATNLAKNGVGFVVGAVNVRYLKPAKLDDFLMIRSKILRVGGASFDVEQDVWRGEEKVVEMKVTLVCIDRNFKAVRLPPVIGELFSKRT